MMHPALPATIPAEPVPPLEQPKARAAQVLRYASLLCGLGPQTGEVTSGSDWGRTAPLAQGRTCIDAGSSLLLSVAAPGGRSLRAVSRLGLPSKDIVIWQRFHKRAGEPVERWRSESYLGEPADTWGRVESAARRVGGLERLRQAHSVLGPRGRIYNLSYGLGERLKATVSWQLDRFFRLDEALEQLGFKGAWGQAAGIWEDLLGFPASLRTGPWSVLIPLHDPGPRLRIGSTNWARRAEDVEKRRRLAALVEQLGGDGRYAEALYKLIEGAGRAGRRPAIGRAAEVEILGDQIVGAEFFLCVP